MIRRPPQTTAQSAEGRDAGASVTSSKIPIGAVACLRTSHTVVGLNANDPLAHLPIITSGSARENTATSIGVTISRSGVVVLIISVGFLRRNPDAAGRRSEVEAGPAERSGIHRRLHRKRHVRRRCIERQRDRRDGRKKPSRSFHFITPKTGHKIGPNAQTLFNLYWRIDDVCSFLVAVKKNLICYDYQSLRQDFEIFGPLPLGSLLNLGLQFNHLAAHGPNRTACNGLARNGKGRESGLSI
jgi:hypothetical protein